MPPTPGLDPQLVTLAKAIRQHESGGDPTKPGKSGEYGAYQFMPQTWDNYAKQAGVNVPLHQASLDQQNEVAYKALARMKQEHPDWNIGNFASAWNAGEADPEAYKGTFKTGQPSTGTNEHGVQYDVPGYAKAIAENYQKFKGQSGTDTGYSPPGADAPDAIVQGYEPPVAPPEAPEEVKTSQDNSKFKASGAVGAVQDTSHGFAKGAIQSGAGILSGLVKLGGGVEGALGMKQAQQSAHKGAASLDAFSGQQGLASRNTAEKVGKGLEAAVEFGVPFGTVTKKVGTGIMKAPSTVAKVAEAISPKLSTKEAAAALNRLGGTKGSLFKGARINPDPSVHRMAEAVMEHVPEFKAKGSLVENLGHVKNAVGRLATDLEKKVVESGKDRIYPVKELGSAIGKAIEKQDVSIGLKGTQYEKQAVALKDAALQIAREKGGKVSDLLPARKEFDDLVDKIYPNLYDREYTPIRNAVKSVRDAMTDFTEKHLPEDVGLKKSYSSQTKLIRAGENLAAKAVSGAEKEIGKSGIKGLIDRHPRITGAVAATAGYQALRNAPIIGSFLP